jgi:hypothetical protein
MFVECEETLVFINIFLSGSVFTRFIYYRGNIAESPFEVAESSFHITH